jgi:hypothetical protein
VSDSITSVEALTRHLFICSLRRFSPFHRRLSVFSTFGPPSISLSVLPSKSRTVSCSEDAGRRCDEKNALESPVDNNKTFFLSLCDYKIVHNSLFLSLSFPSLRSQSSNDLLLLFTRLYQKLLLIRTFTLSLRNERTTPLHHTLYTRCSSLSSPLPFSTRFSKPSDSTPFPPSKV